MGREDKLLYIENENRQRLYYRFTPAALISNFVPLIVILHDEDGRGALNFEYKMWNVLTPLQKGYEGTFWLGRDGDLSMKELLQALIDQIAQEYECEEHIYLYGKGMGGYGAMLHGILSKAHSVYVRSAFMQALHTQESDLKSLLNAEDSFPIFYLCMGKGDEQKKRETEAFIQRCEQFGIEVRTDLCDSQEEDEVKELKKVLNMLEKMGT